MLNDSVSVPVALDNGVRIRVEVTAVAAPAVPASGSEEDVGFRPPVSTEQEVSFASTDFDQVARAIEEIANSLTKSIERIAPKKTTVEFGIELQAEAGALTALIVKGSGKANLKVSMEWS